MTNAMTGAIAGLALVALGAGAGEARPHDEIEISASAERELPNDTLVASVYAEADGPKQADVAAKVNAAIAWALEQMKQSVGVTARTQQYYTNPVYDDRRITAWRARQSLRLEGHDAKAISELLGVLQERTAVESLSFAISTTARNAAEEALTTEAIARFQARAAQVAGAFGRHGYRLGRISVSTAGGAQPPLMFAARAAMAADRIAAAPPPIEAGTQTLSVTVSGSIELDPGQ
ncbi:MAG: SIMPL domain-containing protein [Gammaproteobacteria bacterium]|nr:SIMPL domain-containing protein [Gammaproteobacteria bacterium]MBI5614835.1 SIMPL domain-containing protein [Gammaproteobacteria bacterium]